MPWSFVEDEAGGPRKIAKRDLRYDPTRDPARRRVVVLNIGVVAHPERPRFVVVRNSDDEIVAASHDEEAARAAARLLSL